MRKYNYRRAAAKEKAKETEYAPNTCQICGKKTANCIWEDDAIGHTAYCVCPSCFMWSDELPAVRARADKRPKPTPAASAGQVKTKRGNR